MESRPTPTHYQRLNIPEDASERQIRRAQRRMAWLLHPDRVALDEAEANKRGQELAAANQAAAELLDPNLRARYDRKVGIKQEKPSSEQPPQWYERPVQVAQDPFEMPEANVQQALWEWMAKRARSQRLSIPNLVVAAALATGLAAVAMAFDDSPDPITMGHLPAQHHPQRVTMWAE